MASEEKKLKHIDITQSVISRMAQNSFMLKGWTVTLVAALLALSSAIEERITVILIGLLPAITFWILDGYFLWQERLFRSVYNEIINKEEDKIDFFMNPQDYTGGNRTWFRAIFSKTLMIFYGAVIIALISMIIFLICNQPAGQ
jgi:hypothetical protein